LSLSFDLKSSVRPMLTGTVITARAVKSPSMLDSVSGLEDADRYQTILAPRNSHVKTTGVKITNIINSLPLSVTLSRSRRLSILLTSFPSRSAIEDHPKDQTVD
jgi:hypothetical protein